MATQKKQRAGIPSDADPGVPPEIFAQMMANPPTKEQEAQRLADLQQFHRDHKYLSSIRERVLTEHGDCWIAAYQEEVVAVADTWQTLHDQLEAGGVPKAKAARRHFLENPPHMIPGLRRWL